MKSPKSICPIEKVTELVGDPCSLLIVRDLLAGPKRFGELETSLGSSTRTLAKKLRVLEHEKMIMRKETVGAPACIKYQLTNKGAALRPTVDAMRAYGNRYLR